MMQKIHFRLTFVAQKRCCLSSLFFKRAREPEGKLRHVVSEV